MSYWEALVLGVLQGLTEFLPVSSSGHLELGKALFADQSDDLTFTIYVHAATALSTVVVFRNDLLQLARDVFKPAKPGKDARRYVLLLAASGVPAALVAFTLRHELEDAFLGRPGRIGLALCATAVILYTTQRIGERYARNASTSTHWSLRNVLVVGAAQALAIIPGISRSGSTIGASLALGISPKEAARFSFLMALPVIFGATFLELRELMTGPPVLDAAVVDVMPYLLGAGAAFLSGLVACTWMIRLVQRSGLNIFAAYCAVVGVLAVVLA